MIETLNVLVAQVSQPLNPLLHQWGLAGVVVPFLTLLAPFVYWILTRGELRSVRLKIRSDLASLFQKTVLEEASLIFEQIDDQLPDALSQVYKKRPTRSRFDILCQGLRDIDPEDPDRDKYHTLLKDALSGILVGQFKKMIALLKEDARHYLDGSDSLTGLRFSFAGRTVADLQFLASQISRSISRMSYANRGRKWLKRLLPVAAITGLFSFAPMFVDAPWAYWASVTLLTVFLISWTAGIITAIITFNCDSWLRKSATRDVDDWQAEMERQRQRSSTDL